MSVSSWLGNQAAQRRGQACHRPLVRSARISRAETQNLEWSSMPVNAQHGCRRRAGTRRPRPSATTHRRGPLPTFEPPTAPVPPDRLDQPGTSQRAVDRRRRGSCPTGTSAAGARARTGSAAAPNTDADDATRAPPPRPRQASDAGTNAADATGRANPPARPPHSGPTRMQRLPRHFGLVRRRLHIQTIGDHR